MKIAIGGDHAGFEYKQRLIEKLEEAGYEVKDFGPFSDESVDYPDYVHPLSIAIKEHDFEKGILLCGSGNGVSMTANKHEHVRAALCWNKNVAELARLHNDANVICVPARFVEFDDAEEMVKAFLHTKFEAGRHARRVNKITC